MSSPLVPAYEPLNVLTGMARMFLQPYDPMNPPTLPEDTVALGGEWPAEWVAPGATTEGLSFEFERSTQTITIEEQMTPVDERTQSLTFTANVTLAEDTLKTMRIAYGGGVIETTAAATGTPGISTLVIAEEMETFAFAFEGQNEFGYWRRVLIPRVKSRANVQTAYRRAEAQRSYPIGLASLVAPSEVVIRNMDAPAL